MRKTKTWQKEVKMRKKIKGRTCSRLWRSWHEIERWKQHPLHGLPCKSECNSKDHKKGGFIEAWINETLLRIAELQARHKAQAPALAPLGLQPNAALNNVKFDFVRAQP